MIQIGLRVTIREISLVTFPASWISRLWDSALDGIQKAEPP